MPLPTGLTKPTYYEILEVAPTADLMEIKKAYRRLALQHHPDRNQGSAESKERFQQIGEAYEVLSNEIQRKQYDFNLRQESYPHPSPGSAFHRTSSSSRPSPEWTTATSFPPRRYRDPFAQFDDLFRNDPFFREAFRNMDDVFSQRFQTPNNSPNTTTTQTVSNRTTTTSTTPPPPQRSQQSWVSRLLHMCGVDIQITTYTSTGNGFSATHYSSQAGAKTYTDKKTKSYVDRQGRTVTVQSMERDGNRIQDTYIGTTLVERRVNGVVEPLERIGAF